MKPYIRRIAIAGDSGAHRNRQKTVFVHTHTHCSEACVLGFMYAFDAYTYANRRSQNAIQCGAQYMKMSANTR